MELNEWAKKGQMVSVLDKEVFIIDEGRSENTLVILHGYGTSSIDYYKVLPELTKHFRVVIQDFIGFGFSDKTSGYYFNIIEQADITMSLWRILGLKNITLLSHNYGIQVAIEILTRQRKLLSINLVENLIFLNSTLSFNYKNSSENKIEPLQDFTNRTRQMLTSFSFYKKKLKELFFDDNKISEEEIKAKWTLIHHKEGSQIIDFLYDYNTESKLLWKRWFSYLSKNRIPSKIIVGKNDPIFDENESNLFAEELQNNQLNFIENCGHYPMLEKPKELIQLIISS